MNLDWLNTLREYELKVVAELFGNNKEFSILEIGGGNGAQARQLQEMGYNVKTIDVATSNYINVQVFPVEIYDGFHIPFRDSEFDIVFSSNVLEHIPHVNKFLKKEVNRILKDEGISIHVVPSASWRFWSSITHYIDIPARIIRLFKRYYSGVSKRKDIMPVQRTIPKKILNLLFPLRHGERGNMLTEIWYFSRFGWSSLFNSTNWKIISYKPSGLFYTGDGIGGLFLSIPFRQKLSKFLGSSTHIFVLKKCAE